MKDRMNNISILFITLLVVLCGTCTFASDRKIVINPDLEIEQISEHIYLHISFHDLEATNRFPANGLVYINDKKAIIIDTPWTDASTTALLRWINDSLNATVEAVIATHWHIDWMVGLNTVHNAGINSYNGLHTKRLAEEKKLLIYV
jgi:metallo-beta-lactamase class B